MKNMKSMKGEGENLHVLHALHGEKRCSLNGEMARSQPSPMHARKLDAEQGEDR